MTLHYEILYAMSVSAIGRFSNLKVAYMNAIERSRQDGVTEFRLKIINQDLAELRDRHNVLLYTARLHTPSTNTVVYKEAPPFKFLGKPSMTGWYKWTDASELRLDRAVEFLPHAGIDTFWAVYVDRGGNPLYAVEVRGVLAEAKRRISPNRPGVKLSDLAKEMVVAQVVEGVPPQAVALFLLGKLRRECVGAEPWMRVAKRYHKPAK